jgi:hypothetical protein
MLIFFQATCVALASGSLLPSRPMPFMQCTSLVHQPRACFARMSADNNNDDNEGWDSRDDSELAEHIRRRSASALLGHPNRVMSNTREAWVLIFNPGKANEGVYTLQGKAAYVLAFERPDDADRFAQLLTADEFETPTPLCWDVNQLSNFCDAGEFEMSLVPQGSLVTPPATNEFDREAFDRLKARDILNNAFGDRATDRITGRGPSDVDVDVCHNEGCEGFPDERNSLERLFGGEDGNNEADEGPQGPSGPNDPKWDGPNGGPDNRNSPGFGGFQPPGSWGGGGPFQP